MSKDETKADEAKPAPRFVGGRPRSTVVKLDYPVEFDGKVWDQITVTRLTARELGDYISAVQAAKDGDPPVAIPIFDAPPQVIEALDADDSAALDKVALDFLPRVLRTGSEPPPQDGAAT